MVLIRAPRRADDGAVAVLVAVVTVAVVLPILALVVDLGLTRTLSVRSRAASDAAALAAASQRPSSPNDPLTAAAIDAARALVRANLPEPDGGWPAAWAACVDDSPLPEGTTPSPATASASITTLSRSASPSPGWPCRASSPASSGGRRPRRPGTSTATWADKISPAVGSCALCVEGPYSGGSVRVVVKGGDAATDTVSVTRQGSLWVTGGGVTFASAWTRAGGVIFPLPVKRPVPPDPFAPALAALRVPYGQPSNPGPNGPCIPGVYETVTGCTSFARGNYYVTGNPSSTRQVSLNADATDVALVFTCSASGGSTGVLVAACPSGRPPRFNGAGNAAHILAAPGGMGLALVFDAGLSAKRVPERRPAVDGAGRRLRPGRHPAGGGNRTAFVRGRVRVQALTGTTNFARVVMVQVDAPPVTASSLSNGVVRLVRSD